MLTDQDYRKILHERFGFSDFRKGQLDSIKALMNRGSLLCIHPTGFGKSLLYQLPTVLLEGMTVVISPLLALVRDQVDHLNNRFNIPAAAINSDQSDEENYRTRKLAENGRIKVLFVAPEQLDHVDRFEFLLSLNISLVVVDEAHCISTWGHDFRPSYRQIIQYIQALQDKDQKIRILGLTATANAKTERDIKDQLAAIRPVEILRESMDRPNIKLTSFHCEGAAEKLEACYQLVSQLHGCGLIYCSTRDNTAMVAEYLLEKGVNATSYHAGLHSDEKRRLQNDFIAGNHQVMAATNALGMGIDKQDLRYIIHFDIPGSITAYYQEVGRCGRDGKQARGILLYDQADIKIQQHFIHSSQPTKKDFTDVLDAIKNSDSPPNISTIKRLSGKHPTTVTVIIAELVEQGFVQKVSQGGKQVYLLTNKKEEPNLQRYDMQKETKTAELKGIIHYATQRKVCRMSVLRKALGDEEVNNCGHCSLCDCSDLIINKLSPTLAETVKWVENRPVIIAEVKTNKITAGASLLNGQFRSPTFATFMRKRAETSDLDIGLSDDIKSALLKQAEKFAAQNNIGAVIPLPSRTWGARDSIATMIANHLGVPVFLNALEWRQVPNCRQGQLTNNDQRKHNVQQLMTCTSPSSLTMGGVLLVDDYIGSGVTLKEAARALRKEAFYKGNIVPLTIAQVKWRLGAPGMV